MKIEDILKIFSQWKVPLQCVFFYLFNNIRDLNVTGINHYPPQEMRKLNSAV